MKNMIWFAALSVLTGGMIHLSVMGNGTQVFPRSCMLLAGLRMHENFKNEIGCKMIGLEFCTKTAKLRFGAK